MASIIRRYPVPVVFVAALSAVSAVYLYVLGPAGRRSLITATSTNIAGLRTDPLGTLAASAFIAESAHWAWVLLAVAGLFPLAHRLGNLRALLVVACAHVAGTLVSEGVLAWRISAGEAPASMRLLDDVGPSYVIVAALVVTAVYGPVPGRRPYGLFDRAGRWWRLAAAAGLVFVAPSLLSGLGHLDVAAVGHVVATTTGLTLGWALAGERARLVLRNLLASVRQLRGQ